MNFTPGIVEAGFGITQWLLCFYICSLFFPRSSTSLNLLLGIVSPRRYQTSENNRNQSKTMPSANESSLAPFMPTETAVKQKLPLQPPAQNIFPLLHLPRELRDTIYRHSISSGDLEILRINRLVNEEASELLPKYAALRVNLGFQDRTNWVRFGSASLPSIQHVEFLLHTSSYAIPFGLEPLADFSDH